MTGYLLGTNVISELSRNVPNPDVVAFLSDEDDLWLSSVVAHEIEYGLELLPAGRRRDLLSEIQSSTLRTVLLLPKRTQRATIDSWLSALNGAPKRTST